MVPFLQQIAQIYSKLPFDQLLDICFVFPNRRSIRFFRKYLQEFSKTAFIEPRMATLNELIAEHSIYAEASRDDSLFILYNCYKELSEEIPSFDRFLFWGSMLIDDFNEVDNYLVDPSSLFVNVERWKEIKSNYLTDEQRRIIKHYWGIDLSDQSVDQFWQHTIDECNDDTNAQFLRLWEILAPLYESFTRRMRSNGLATSGMLTRETCNRLKNEPESVFTAPQYVFVGFDFPSTAELYIFETLRNEKRAEFYWDFNLPVTHQINSRLTSMMKRLEQEFKATRPIDEAPISTYGEIEIMAIPSETAQAREVSSKLEEWIKNKSIKNVANPLDTAIVLPEEGLFVPLVESIPAEIKTMNVTMGFPMKLTPVAGLIGMLISLNIRSRLKHGQSREFFYEDVEDILTNPMIRRISPESCDQLIEKIHNDRLYTLSSEVIASAHPLFAAVFGNNDVMDNSTEAHNYVNTLLDTLSSQLSTQTDKLELMFIESFRRANDSLYESTMRHGIEMAEMTYLELLEGMTNLQQVNFEGQPLSGLQIMGVLETRTLDFDNVIVTSMNERVFPKKASKKSFIPESLRTAFGMPSADFAEKKYAYYFFRLLARASHTLLTYDSRTGGLKSGEMSRFIMQLLYLYPAEKIKHSSQFFRADSLTSETIDLPKTPEIMERIIKYTIDPKKGGKTLSASALKTYISCPLKFCLANVLHLDEDDKFEDFMESSTYGTVVHGVAQNLYQSLGKSNVNVNANDIQRWLDSPTIIDNEITKNINEHFNKLPEGQLDTPLNGELEVIGKAIKRIIEEILRHDLSLTPFTFVSAEDELPASITLSDGRNVYFTQKIDRVDEVNGVLRIVDYKTGDEKTDLGDAAIEDITQVGKKNNYLSIFQVLLYCVLYKEAKNYPNAIQPVIYELRHILTKGINPITIGSRKSKKVLDDYRTIENNFTSNLIKLIEEILDPQKKFTQTQDDKACLYCKFKRLCGR